MPIKDYAGGIVLAVLIVGLIILSYFILSRESNVIDLGTVSELNEKTPDRLVVRELGEYWTPYVLIEGDGPLIKEADEINGSKVVYLKKNQSNLYFAPKYLEMKKPDGTVKLFPPQSGDMQLPVKTRELVLGSEKVFYKYGDTTAETYREDASITVNGDKYIFSMKV